MPSEPQAPGKPIAWRWKISRKQLNWCYGEEYPPFKEAVCIQPLWQCSESPMIGEYRADYSQLTPEEIAKSDPALDELYANSRPVTKSAPALHGSLPSGESDPSVTLDYTGADTHCSEEMARTCATCHAVLADGPQPAATCEPISHLSERTTEDIDREYYQGLIKELDAEVTRLRNENSDLANRLLGDGASSWRDIETAPRDGTRVLASDGSIVEVIYWADGWFNQSAEISTWNAFPPTSWMPLPDCPVVTRPQEKTP